MNRDKLHRTHLMLGLSFSLATMVMSTTLLVLHFAYPEKRGAIAMVFGLWAAVAVVVLIIESVLFNKIHKQYLMDRDEIKKQIEALKHGP